MEIRLHEEQEPLPPSAREDVPQTRGYKAAVSIATEALLNCYTREGGDWRPVSAASVPEFAQEGDEFVAILPFPDERTAVLAGVRYLSPTHRHRFRTPAYVAMAGGKPWAIGVDTLMGMLADELGASKVYDDDISAAGTRGPDPTFLLARIRQHITTLGAFLDARADEIDELWSADPLGFADSEQAGLLGNMAHPAPKSRWELDPAQSAAYAPEAQARLTLRWLAVDPALVASDSATGTPAAELTEQLLRGDAAVDGAALDAALAGLGERVLLPVHPWELEHLRAREDVAALLADGRISELGALGSEVSATASPATVYNADWPWQLTLGLHVQMTDELRLADQPQLQRAVDVARELAGETGAAVAEIAPELTVLQDPAYLTVQLDGTPVEGLSVQLRENRWAGGAGGADVSSLEVLVQDHPFDGTSRLGQIVARLAAESGRPAGEIAREWFGRYAGVALVPLLRLYAEPGLSLQADQQSTLLELDGGWPVRCVLRDARSALVGQAAHDDVPANGDGLGEGPFLDNALAVVNALGVAGAIEEIELLGDLKALLVRERERDDSAATLLDRLLNDATWPCRARMRTRLHESDQYIRIPNPLHGVSG
jgi:siderophore synthetase component